MSSSISIIIPSLHSPLIDQVIAALRMQTAPFHEIIIVGQDRHNLVPPDVTFLHTKRPLSAAAARNLGARHASGDYLLFIDSDCIASAQLIERFQVCHAHGLSIVGGGVMPAGTSYWAACDNLLVFADFLSSSPAGERSFLPSLNFCLPRALFLELGGFDTSYPGAAGEDLDFSLRLRAAGYQLYFEPMAWLEHRHERASARHVWEHLRGFGRVQPRIARAHPTLSASRIDQLPHNSFGLIMAGSFFLACLDVITLFATRTSLQPYLRALPGMVWARMGWYWGVAEALSVSDGKKHI